MNYTENTFKGVPVKSQHKVPRKYLRAWENNDGKIVTLRKVGSPFYTVVENVETESWFYKFELLSELELRFLYKFVCDSRGLGFPVEIAMPMFQATVGSAIFNAITRHEIDSVSVFNSYVRMLSELRMFEDWFLETLVYVWHGVVTGVELDENSRNIISNIVKNGGEFLMCEVEDRAWPALELAIAGNSDLIETNTSHKASLVTYMVYQMFRGTKFVSIFNEDRTLSAESNVKVGRYVRYFAAEMVLSNLIPRLGDYCFIPVENTTEIEFLTGDAPVVNIAARNEPMSFDLYFPVSPTKAVLLVSRDRLDKCQWLEALRDEDADELNRQICGNCVEQIHARDERAFARGYKVGNGN